MTINSLDKVKDLASIFTPDVLELIQKALIALLNLGYLMSALYMVLQIKKLMSGPRHYFYRCIL